jgi:hypothetical protein
MRKIVLSVVGSALMAASMATTASAAEHQVRHERIYTSERVQYVPDYFYPIFVTGQSALAQSDTPWLKSGLRPDDWRQSVNGG